MATDVERLLVTLEASTKQYTNEIKKVRSETNRMFQAMQGEITANSRRVESAFGQMGSRAGAAFKESLISIARGGIASFLGGFAFEKLAENVRESVKAVADLGDEAADLGLSTQSLQVFSRLAIEAGTDADQMAKALAQVAQQSQDTGSKMSKLFATMGRTVTGDVTTDMLTLMNIIERMESPTQRLATLMDVFGAKLGRSLAEALTSGSQAYFDTLHKMERDGDIFTDAQVKNARKLDAEWNTLTDHLTTQWHQFILASIADAEKLLDWMRTNRTQFQNWLIPEGGSERLKGLQRSLEQTPSGGFTGSTTNVPGNIQADFAEAVAQFKNLSTGLLAEVARQESGFKQSVVSPKGAIGVMQLMPGTAADLGVNPRDLHENIMGGAKYLSDLLQEFGDLKLALAAYNAGPGAVKAAGGDISKLPLETQNYVAAIMSRLIAARRVIETTSGVPAGHVGTPGYQQGTLPGLKPSDLPAGFDLSDVKTVEDATKGWRDYNDALSAVERSTGQMTASQALMIASMRDVIKGVKEVNDALASSVETFAQQLLDGASASDALKSALRQLAQQMLHMAIQGLFNFGGASGGLLGSLIGLPKQAPGFATGGSFRVGGSGGTDSRMVAFRATPGEYIDISRPGMRGRGGGGGASISMGGIAINVEGSADERTLAIMERRLQQAQAKQLQDIQRNWGVMTSRYQSHRGP